MTLACVEQFGNISPSGGTNSGPGYIFVIINRNGVSPCFAAIPRLLVSYFEIAFHQTVWLIVFRGSLFPTLKLPLTRRAL